MAAKLPCSELKIRDIRVAVYIERSAPRPPSRRPRALSPTNSRLLRAVAEEMDDPALRDSLRRLSNRQA